MNHEKTPFYANKRAFSFETFSEIRRRAYRALLGLSDHLFDVLFAGGFGPG